MPEDWSKLRDIDPLADAGARIDFAIPLAEFPRLQAQLANSAGLARGHVRFARRGAAATATVEVSARPELRCQRCLQGLPWTLTAADTVAVVSDDAEAERSPAELDTILAAGHRLSLRDIVEEELLLSLPIVARHPQGECAPGPLQPAPERVREQQPQALERQRPFERLGELLRRDK